MESVKYFTQKELKKLFKKIEDNKGEHQFWLRNLAMFKIGYVCGLRISEIKLLKLDHYNTQTGEIFCTRVKNSNSNTIRLPKDVNTFMKRYVREYGIVDPDEPLFKSKRGNGISERQIHKLMKEYTGTINKPRTVISPDKCHWHTLKHSIAVHMAESGADVKELQGYLGHKDVKNTMIYFKYTTKQVDSFYNKISKNSQLAVS